MKCSTPWIALFGLCLHAIACDGGFSNEEAVDVCRDLQQDLACVDDAAYVSCVACYEDCGRDCQLVTTNCPHDFICE